MSGTEAERQIILTYTHGLMRMTTPKIVPHGLERTFANAKGDRLVHMPSNPPNAPNYA